MVSDLFDATAWRDVPGFEFDDITYHRAVDHGTVRIAFNRPEVRNAFRPRTVDQLYTAERFDAYLALGRWSMREAYSNEKIHREYSEQIQERMKKLGQHQA